MKKLRYELVKAIEITTKRVQEHKDELPEYWYFEGQLSALLSVLNQIDNHNENK